MAVGTQFLLKDAFEVYQRNLEPRLSAIEQKIGLGEGATYAGLPQGLDVSDIPSFKSLYIKSSTTAPFIQIINQSDTARDPVIQFAVGATPVTKFTVGIDDSDSDKFKISLLDTLGVVGKDILTIDSSGRVGGRTATPDPLAAFHWVSAGLTPNTIYEETVSGWSIQLCLRNTARDWWIQADSSPDMFSIEDRTYLSPSFEPKTFIIQGGSANAGFWRNSSASWGANAKGVGIIGIVNTAPTSSPSDSFQFWAADFGAGGTVCPFIRTENNVVVKLNQNVATDAVVQFVGLGLGVAPGSNVLHTKESVFANTPLFERSGQTTNSVFSAIRILATKTTDMGDGFGSEVSYLIQDNAGVLNPIGSIGFRRAGADDSGTFYVKTIKVGGATEKFSIDPDGILTVNAMISAGIVMNSVAGVLSGGNTLLGLIDLVDPGADRIIFWDESENLLKWLSLGDSLGIVGTVLDTIQDIRISASPIFAGLILTDIFRHDYTVEHILLLGYQAGKNLAANGQYNIFVGEQAGYSVTTGDRNTYFGYQAGYSNVGDADNVCLGYKAGYAAVSSKNTLIGSTAGQAITTGLGNVAIGYEALKSVTSSSDNTAIGSGALKSLTSGGGNLAIGSGAAIQLTTGARNVAIGYFAGWDWISSTRNIAIGFEACKYNVGSYNIGIGQEALHNPTNDPGATASYNVALGCGSMYQAITASYNVGLGASTLLNITSGQRNFALGYEAGYSLTTQNGNVFIGYKAGRGLTVSNRLYIVNDDVVIPLVYGEFDTGNIGLGTIILGTDSSRNFGVGAGVAPISSPADMAHFWVEDIDGVAGSAGFHTRPECVPAGAGKHIIVSCLVKTDTGDPVYDHEAMIVINTFDNVIKIRGDGDWRTIASW